MLHFERARAFFSMLTVGHDRPINFASVTEGPLSRVGLLCTYRNVAVGHPVLSNIALQDTGTRHLHPVRLQNLVH